MTMLIVSSSLYLLYNIPFLLGDGRLFEQSQQRDTRVSTRHVLECNEKHESVLKSEQGSW